MPEGSSSPKSKVTNEFVPLLPRVNVTPKLSGEPKPLSTLLTLPIESTAETAYFVGHVWALAKVANPKVKNSAR